MSRRTNQLRIPLDDETERPILDRAAGHYATATWARSVLLEEAERVEARRLEQEADRAQVKALGRVRG